jgi:electron-transferring-flavoprotein dehydrogenase
MNDQIAPSDRESMEVDVVIVGAGPAGLATACRLMQLSNENAHPLSVTVLEKGSEVGAHILSGAVIETTALDELFPDWPSMGAPLQTRVSRDEIYFYTNALKTFKWPNYLAPKPMHNRGNYIGSLGRLARWLGEQAENLGVEIYPGFSAGEVLIDKENRIVGVATGDMGIAADGTRKNTFEPGMELRAKYTVFAEGSRGHLGKEMIHKYHLGENMTPQHFGIGLKELWEVDGAKHQPGLVVHGAGWPLSESKASGGSFLYHFEDRLVTLGLIVDLSYTNPHLSPFDELQRYKTHPSIKKFLKGGKRIGYGARAITKGGINSLPKMSMPGALLIGCDAGTLNFSKIKGTHTAMKSGMVAAETLFEALRNDDPGGRDLTEYHSAFQKSWAYSELYASRNFGPALHRFGTYLGGAFNFIDQNWFRGRLPFTLKDRSEDHANLSQMGKSKPIDYPKPDGELTFDKNSSVFLTNTHHEEDQPVHLRLSDPSLPLTTNLPRWGEPAQLYCPAGVYEIVEDSAGQRFQINAQNCIHCKTCDIKDPSQNITWVTPEGGGGPNYAAM